MFSIDIFCFQSHNFVLIYFDASNWHCFRMHSNLYYQGCSISIIIWLSTGASFGLWTKIFFGIFFRFASNKIDLLDFFNSRTVFSVSRTPQKYKKSLGFCFKKKMSIHDPFFYCFQFVAILTSLCLSRKQLLLVYNKMS